MASDKKIVLVTGGNNGIGLETVGLFAEQPDVHVIMASRSLEKGEAALAKVKARAPQGSFSLVQLDVSSDESIAAAVRQVETSFGRLDTLVNNAGTCPMEPLDRASMQHTLETNATSPTLVTAAFIPLLRKSASPRVVYVSSSMGSVAGRYEPSSSGYDVALPAYRISKAALNMVAACDAWEYAKYSVKVFVYCPGYVLSDLGGWRDFKEKSGVPGPEKSAQGLLEIHHGKQDKNAGEFLSSVSVVDGASFHAW